MTDPHIEADLTLEEVAQITRKSYDLIARMARDGKLPGAYQLTKRGRWAVRRHDFEAWRLGLGPQQVDPHAIPPRSSISQSRRRRRAA